MKLQHIILLLLLAAGITFAGQTTNKPPQTSDTRTLTLTGHYPGFFVLDRKGGQWPVAANLVVKTAMFDQVTNRIDEISGLISNKLATVKKEDLGNGMSLKTEANRLFTGDPILTFKLWVAVK